MNQLEQITHTVTVLLEKAVEEFNFIKLKVIRNQPPKKLDIAITDKVFNGSRIKIRNIKVDSNHKVTYTAECKLEVLGVNDYTLNQEQAVLADKLTKLITEQVIKMYYLKG